jgi:hypothetical protein
MALLQVTLVLLVTAFLNTEAANIPGPEGKSIKDIFSTLNTFKTNIISLISEGFSAPKKLNPPAPQESYHHIVLPPPPPHVPHHLSKGLYVTSPPHLGHHNHSLNHSPSLTPTFLQKYNLWRNRSLLQQSPLLTTTFHQTPSL